MTIDVHPTITQLLTRLTLEEKVGLLTGRDFWTTVPLPGIGLRSMVLSDGPSGIRGEVWDERSPSLNLPSATALSSSWDEEIARRYGNAAAVEARRKGVDVVLGPTINLHRSPLGGRHFEAFSEDPVLTAALAAAYVTGVQEYGVAATPKHYVANDSETERFTVSVEIDDRTLRELYLLAFERSVTEAQAWAVMSAYNAVNGVTATENDLLESPLNSEWGFDGVVVSDWTAVRSLDSASASQDLVMPGPNGPWGAALVDAVREGRVAAAAVDRKVGRLLRLAARVGALEGVRPAGQVPPDPEDGVAFAREAAVEGTVLLHNDGVLPLEQATLSRVAVIGHNATDARTQGGGSATVIPERVVSPLAGLRSALPGVRIDHALGAVNQQGMAPLPLAEIQNPATGEAGMLVRFLDAGGEEMFREDRLATHLVYFGGDAPVGSAARIVLSTRWTPSTSGTVRLGFASVGRGRIILDGEVAHDGTAEAVGDDLGASLLAPPSVSTDIAVTAGRPLDVVIDFDLTSRERIGMTDALSITLGLDVPDVDAGELIAEAVEVARGADVAVVVVGTNSAVESEGYDRTGLPGHQDDLVRAVAATGTPTLVVVNAGSPVELPWRSEVGAIVVPYFGGQEIGNALADVLLGRAEPGGRLPTTWPAHLADVPVSDVKPVEGRLAYDEGIHIGYRAYLRSGTEPAYPFGHGLGYTTWELGGLEVSQAVGDDGVRVALEVTNTGDRPGKHVVQVYLARPQSTEDRPARWLAGHAVVRLGAGASRRVEIPLPRRSFAHWHGGWAFERGAYQVLVGSSVVDLPLRGETRLP